VLVVTYFNAVIDLSARSKTYINLYFLNVLSNRGEAVLVCINFMCDDASMASCDKRSRQKSTL